MLLCSLSTIAQDVVNDSISVDNQYREDQFYINVTYNIVTNTPSNFELRGLSGGFGFGYIRDIPVNAKRNLALGLGLGFSFNQYGQNLFIGESSSEETVFSVLDDNTDYDVNRFSTATIEVPLELRWRTSTATKYKFWRIYTGVRVGYTYWYHSTFTQDDNKVSQSNISEFEPLRFTPFFSFGFNKINFFASYTVSPFFKEAKTDLDEAVGFNPVNLGLIFYIL